MWTPQLKLGGLKSFFHSDFAFRQDSTLATLPLVIAFLTVLSICLTHSAVYIKHVTLSGSEALTQRLHLHLPHDTPNDALTRLLDELANIEGIEMVEEVPAANMQAFLQKWLGLSAALSEDFPLPTILDITLQPQAQREIVQGQIQYYLQQNLPDALLESYDDTIAAFNRSSHMIKSGIYMMGFVVMIATTLIVGITSRINLGVHRHHILMLHHLGASDQYINRQFMLRAGLISLQGIALGTLLSIIFIELLTSYIDMSFLINGSDGIASMWIYYIINPTLLIILVLAASWLSIETELKKIH
jgi:cell division transport system permease protein